MPFKNEERIFPRDYEDRIFCEDCLIFMKGIPNESVSLILTDPPYGIHYSNQFAKNPHAMLPGDEGIDYPAFARESYRILRMNSHAYFFTRFDCYPHHFQCLKEAGFTIKNCLVIEKGTLGGIGDLKGSYASSAEWVIFCQKGGEFSTQLRFWKTGIKKALCFTRDASPANGIKHGFRTAGSAQNTRRPHIIPCGRKRMESFIQR